MILDWIGWVAKTSRFGENHEQMLAEIFYYLNPPNIQQALQQAHQKYRITSRVLVQLAAQNGFMDNSVGIRASCARGIAMEHTQTQKSASANVTYG